VLKRVLAQALEDHGLTVRLGFELEFYLLSKPGSSGGSGGQQPGVPAPIDSSNYCLSSAFDAAAPGGLCLQLRL